MIKALFSGALALTITTASLTAQGVSFRFNNYDIHKKDASKTFIQGAEVGYVHNLTKALDLYVPFRLTPHGDVETFSSTGTKSLVQKVGTFALDAALQAKYDNGRNFIVPFLSGGAGFETYDNGKLNWGAPIGGGLHFRLGTNAFLTAATNYRLPITDGAPKGWAHSIGLTFKLNDKFYDNVKEMPTPVIDNKAQLEAAAQAAKAKAEAEAKAKAEAEAAAKAQAEAQAKAEAEAKAKAEAAAREAAARAQAEADAKARAAREAAERAAREKAEAEARAKQQNQKPVITEEEKKVLDYALQGVQFETGSSQLTKASYPVLDKVAAAMQANPNLKISIEGHTDKTGNEATNVKLSEARAKACMTYLTSKGIAAARFKATGVGSARPVADNSTPEGRRKNRRVEFNPF